MNPPPSSYAIALHAFQGLRVDNRCKLVLRYILNENCLAGRPPARVCIGNEPFPFQPNANGGAIRTSHSRQAESVIQAEFLEGLRFEKGKLELSQPFR